MCLALSLRRRARRAAVLLLIPVVLGLSAAGCAQLSYYRQSAAGQLDIAQRREAIDALIADAHQDTGLRERLELVREMRAFAVSELQLPDTGSYTQYADLGRDYAVLALYAAPEFSTELKTWCYPVAGCAAYRGYFDRAMLERYARKLKQQHYDIYIAAVPAYSTLGWFDDPLLNTVLDWPEPQMAGLIFHELAHQQLYVKGDTAFNESFATAVERAGVERWLQARHGAAAVERYRRRWREREVVVQLLADARSDLAQLYARKLPASQLRVAKQQRLEKLRRQYRELREGTLADGVYDALFAGTLNNARLGSVAAYHIYVDSFLAMLAEQQGDFPAFYAAAARMAALPPDERRQSLAALM
jgi:predicted aminopeptidase